MRQSRSCFPALPALPFRLTLVGRAAALLAFELLFNVACWVAAGLCLAQADGLLGLALLAWTLGLRHGLDADHISAIDNATRQMVSMGRLPLTCGLWFSLGHSTIVIAVNIAIAVSVDIYDKLDGVGAIGGIVGTAVSASFLFLVAVINSWFLFDALRHRRARKQREAMGLPPAENEAQAVHGGGCLVRIVGPILRAVDAPWKLYPVGVLFGFGFDTASSIALLALSALATRDKRGNAISHGRVVILPFLFTAGMSLVDSLDSILMLWAYAQPELKVDGRWRLFECRDSGRERLLGQEGLVLGSEGSAVGNVERVERSEGAHGAKWTDGGKIMDGEEEYEGGEEREHREGPKQRGTVHRTESEVLEQMAPTLPAVGPSSLNVDGKDGDVRSCQDVGKLTPNLTSGLDTPGRDTPSLDSKDVNDDLDTKPLDTKDPSSSIPTPTLDPSDPKSIDTDTQPHPDTHLLATKTATISTLSISLTLLSIAVALSISLIEIMGLIGEQCRPCREAAEAEDGGGLAGSWWRAWARANDASGYVGAAIVGCFVAILCVYHGVRWGVRRHRRRMREGREEA